MQAAADAVAPAAGQRVTGHAEEGGWAQYAAVPTGSLAVIAATSLVVTNPFAAFRSLAPPQGGARPPPGPQ